MENISAKEILEGIDPDLLRRQRRFLFTLRDYFAECFDEDAEESEPLEGLIGLTDHIADWIYHQNNGDADAYVRSKRTLDEAFGAEESEGVEGSFLATHYQLKNDKLKRKLEAKRQEIAELRQSLESSRPFFPSTNDD